MAAHGLHCITGCLTARQGALSMSGGNMMNGVTTVRERTPAYELAVRRWGLVRGNMTYAERVHDRFYHLLSETNRKTAHCSEHCPVGAATCDCPCAPCAHRRYLLGVAICITV
jgi:hypothetical protein